MSKGPHVTANDADRKRVLVVDDSAAMRQLLTRLLGGHSDLEVVGSAIDPFDAREQIKALSPDVLTLDVEMPRMNGLQFLRNLMRLRPMPVVMVSSLTARGAEATLDALSIGAVDFITKPNLLAGDDIDAFGDELATKVRVAASARSLGGSLGQLAGRPSNRSGDRRAAVNTHAMDLSSRQLESVPSAPSATIGARQGFGVIAVGASTGGTEAIGEVLKWFTCWTPPVVIAQHIPAMFSASFARRLDAQCAIAVSEAEDGQPAEQGHAYVAPGGRHLSVIFDRGNLVCRVTDEARVNKHRPSVDVLFESVAKIPLRHVGVLLTGMGADGAAGLLAMREAGAATVVQDEATSVVWGMPGRAHGLGAAAEVVPLDAIGQRVLSRLKDSRTELARRAIP